MPFWPVACLWFFSLSLYAGHGSLRLDRLALGQEGACLRDRQDQGLLNRLCSLKVNMGMPRTVVMQVLAHCLAVNMHVLMHQVRVHEKLHDLLVMGGSDNGLAGVRQFV